MSIATFVSPLSAMDAAHDLAIDFGGVPLTPVTRRLAASLDAQIRAPIGGLPQELRAEATRLLAAYPGPDRKFIGLFYVPIWSFLAHVPREAQRRPTRTISQAATTAHALSLFLHLWDDHVCDGQLPLDIVRLQLRGLAWQRFQRAVDRLAKQIPEAEASFERLIAGYLTSVHRQVPARDLAAYCERFRTQIGIWRVAPLAIGFASDEGKSAERLEDAICSFAIAWRILDDLQDLEDDLISGQDNAVFHMLNAEEKRCWNKLRRSIGHGDETDAWASFWRMVQRGNVIARARTEVSAWLDKADRNATDAGWMSLSAELSMARRLERKT